MSITLLREQYHQQICQHIIRINTSRSGKQYPNLADGSSRSSVEISWQILEQLGCKEDSQTLSGQRAGSRFEEATRAFLESSFSLLTHLRPGDWIYKTSQTAIINFEQYEHLAYVERAVRQDYNLVAMLGNDYIITPDIVITRHPISDAEVNAHENILSPETELAAYTPLRQRNRETETELLHASISCKWTIRSDRSQNTRTEALNLIRNRKGPLPHVVAVTAEPLPTRLAALTLGTGDLDCVYHFALPELLHALQAIDNADQLEMLEMMVNGRRLRDISDLPFDLAI